MKTFQLLFLLLSMPFFLAAQNIEAGIFLGGSAYSGDLIGSRLPTLKETHSATGILLRHHINTKLAVRSNLLLGRISGDDANYPEMSGRSERKFSFKSVLAEASLTLEWSPLAKPRYNSDGTFKPNFTPYFFAGFGGNYTKPRTDYNSDDISASLLSSVKEDQSSLASDFNVSFPIGGGVKFDVNEYLILGVDLGVRPTMSDLLDGVAQSGNSDVNDWYGFGGITITGRLGKMDKKDVLQNMVEVEAPRDGDGDGIADFDDHCPTVSGKAAFNGCPDTDNDGIADNDDNCPDLAGTAELAGCPDTDKDGVADTEDECPELSGAVALNGCPDRDNDGIADRDDNCPDESGVSGNNGCPEVIVNTDQQEDPGYDEYGRKNESKFDESNGQAEFVTLDNKVADIEVVELLEEAMEKVKFDLSSVHLKSESYPILDEIANLMAVHPDYFLTIKGYADNSGTSAVNKELSMRRARRCFKYLANVGVSPRKMTFVGLGADNPIGDNNTEEGRSRNRRVEFEITRQ